MITTSVESRVEFPATRIQSLGSLLSVWANVSGTQSWVANGGRRACSAHPACPCREGLVAYLRALGTIIKRERARERTERGKTQKWQSRSLGPPRVLTRASPRVRTCLGPRSVPSTYAFLHHPPPHLVLWPLFSIACTLSNTLSAMVSLEELLPIDEPRDLSTGTSTDFLVEILFLNRYRTRSRKERLFVRGKNRFWIVDPKISER